MTQIKICGLTTVEQALACADLGANYLGLNCYKPSPRYIAPEQIQNIVQALPESVTTVGVFVNEEALNVQEIMHSTGLSLAQLHGDESPLYAQNLHIPFIKAFRVASGFQQEQIFNFYEALQDNIPNPEFLLDSWCKEYGGSGKVFNWELAHAATSHGKLFLAGGLTPHNIAEAIYQVHPYGVDICSSVEASPGVKDLELVKHFIAEVRKVDGISGINN